MTKRTNRCKNCKHWDTRQQTKEIPGLGLCTVAIHYWDSTQWAKDGESRELIPEHANKLAFVRDMSDYGAELLTLPDFGCVQQERCES